MGKAGAKDHTGRIVRTLPPGMIKGTVPSGIRANEWIVSYTALGKVCLNFSSSSPVSSYTPSISFSAQKSPSSNIIVPSS